MRKKSNIVNISYIRSKFMSLALSLTAAVSLFSCSASDITGGEDTPMPVTVAISLGVQNGTSATRALSDNENGNESTVNDVNVLVFNSMSGNLVTSSYISSSPLSSNKFELMTNTVYDIYAVANYGADIATTKSISTVSALKSLTTPTLASAAALGGGNSVIMEGSVLSKTVTASTTGVEIPMSRLCGKTKFTITPSDGITITGYRLHSVPLSSYIVEPSAIPSSVTDGGYAPFDVVKTSSTAAVSDTYYTYENLRGNVAACTTEKLRNTTDATLPDSATYLEIYAKTSSWHSVYRVYMGEVDKGTGTNDYTDFNVRRNHSNTYNISITGSGDGDKRVTYTEIILGDFYQWDAYSPYVSGATGTWGEGSEGYHTGDASSITASQSCKNCPSYTDLCRMFSFIASSTTDDYEVYLAADAADGGGVAWTGFPAGDGTISGTSQTTTHYSGLWIPKKSLWESYNGTSSTSAYPKLLSETANKTKFSNVKSDYIFLPAAGYLYGGSYYSVGAGGGYWSSAPTGSSHAYDLYFYSIYARVSDYDDRSTGFLVWSF